MKVTTGTVGLDVSINKPIRAGYSFAGWVLSLGENANAADAKYKVGDVYTTYSTGVASPADVTVFKNLTNVVGSTVIMTAQWTVNNYTIKIGSVTKVEEIAFTDTTTTFRFTGSELTAPTGYHFDKYTLNGITVSTTTDYTIQSFLETFMNSVDKSYSEKLITIPDNCWTANEYTINLVLDGGKLETTTTTTKATYNVDKIIENPTRDGYTFRGWASTNVNTTTALAGNVSWSSALTEVTDYKGVQHSVTATTIFKNLVAEGEVTLTAIWSENTYNVTIDLNGGELTNATWTHENTSTNGNLSVSNVNEDIYFSAVLTLGTPEKTGYTFSNWEIIAGNNTTLYDGKDGDPSPFSKLTKDNDGSVTIKAIYTNNKYTVKTYVNGVEINSADFYYDIDIVNMPAGIKENYTFIGWEALEGLDSNTALRNTSNSKDGMISWDGSRTTDRLFFMNLTPVKNGVVKLNALFTPNVYKVNVNLNGGTLDGVSLPISVTFEDYVNEELGIPVKEGYTFIGWSAEEGSNVSTTLAKVYDAINSTWISWNGSVTLANIMNLVATQNNTVGTENPIVTLDANWKANTYTIKYELDNGTNGTYAPNSADFGEVVTISNPVKDGYSFLGWTSTTVNTTTALVGSTKWSEALETVTDYNNNQYQVTDGTSFTSLVTDGEVTLTAIWSVNTYTIKTTGLVGADGSYDATFDTAVTIANPEKTGYTFAGWIATGLYGKAYAGDSIWNGTATKETSFLNLVTGAENDDEITLTATWTNNTYNVTFKLEGGKINDSTNDETREGTFDG